MKYSLLMSTLYFICGFFYMSFGAYAIAYNAKSRTNRLFLFVTSSLAIWSFAYAISNSAPTAEVSAFWRCMSVFGWGIFHSLLLHFALILTKVEKRINQRVMFAVLYVPVIINVILFAPFGFLAEKQYAMVPSDFGWRNTLPANMGQVWINAYYIIYTAIAVILLVRWWKKMEPHSPMKRHVTYLLIAILFPFVAGTITDILPGVLGVTQTPRLTLLFLIFPAVLLFITLKKFGVLIDRGTVQYLPSDLDMMPEESRLRLFETATAIFMIGAAGSFYVGYFIAGRDLTRELLLAFVVMNLGIFLRFIPSISKNHAVQNTLFLIASIVGMTFFLMKDVDMGAATVWAIYIVFLLYTVVLNSNIHAFVFLVITLALQVVVWMISPDVSVAVDNSQYIKRIFIIVLSFVAVRYLTNEYTAKLRGYQSFSKGQEVLEAISSSFISADRENARGKINEMFEMSAEILGFDHAYLVEFDTNYQEALFLNTYVKDVATASLPYHPKMKVKTATLPMAGFLIAQKQPIMCGDIINISAGGDEKDRNFFLSRGVNSFFAVPIMSDEELVEMLVIEYYEKCDMSARESRLTYLEIIANILGDARQKIAYEEKLYEFAYFDETTKLANKNMLRKALKHILYSRKESGKVAILNIELENLRMINDTFGHGIGEQITINSAKILESLLKEGCYISRIGEGEFVVVMPAVENIEQIEKCANKIIDSFSSPVFTERGTEALFVIVNIGISVYPDDGRDDETLLRNADLAGYEAKTANEKIVFFTEQLKNHVAETTLFTNRLFNSLQNEEFSLEFQPQVRCDTGKTVGIEALLRWTTDGQRRVPPDRFIPILEQTGLIYDVGLWVLKQALQEHNRLVEKGFSPLRVSVNLSVVQFQNKDFVSDVSKIIKESRVEPKYIELEITESLFSKNPAEVIQKLHQLKELGVRVAIDDFGREYSSLNRLKLVPFDRIKIDKDIIDYIDLERKKAPITQVIILLARAFQAVITAEGVETKEQAEFLKSITCDEIQRYYFSRPLSPDALEEFLKKNEGNLC